MTSRADLAMSAKRVHRFVEKVLDSLEITDMVYHDFHYSMPQVEDILFELVNNLDRPARVLTLGPNTLLAQAISELGYEQHLYKFGDNMLTDELEAQVRGKITPETLASGEVHLGDDRFDAIILPFVFEHVSINPARVVNAFRPYLRRDGLIIALTRNLTTLGMRIRGALGRRVMPDWRAPQVMFAMNWPILQPYRFYTKRELETYCREAGLVPVTNAHRLGKTAFSHADFMGIRQYATAKAKHWLKSSVPAFREFILLTLAQPTGEELRLGAVSNGTNQAATDDDGLTERPFVSVVVPTKDRAEMLCDCFAGLIQQTYPADRFEVVLVNDGSSDDTEEVVQEKLIPAAPFSVRYVKTTGIGATAARNLGMQKASGEIVAHLDDDCRPVPEWMEEGVRGFSDESVAMVGGPVYPKPEQPANFFSITASYTDDRGAYPTANIFLRRDVAIETGGFDLSFGGNLLGRPVSGWDADLVWRMRRRGYRPKFRRGAQVYMEIFQQEPLEWVLHSWRMITLPKMVKRIPEIDRYLLLNRYFAHESTFWFDLAVAGAVLAAARRNPLPLITAVAWAAWWAPKVAPNDMKRPHRWPKIVAKLGLIGARQAVCLGALIAGSAGARRVVI